MLLTYPADKAGIPFRFVRLLPRIFGVEIIAVWRHRDHKLESKP